MVCLFGLGLGSIGNLLLDTMTKTQVQQELEDTVTEAITTLCISKGWKKSEDSADQEDIEFWDDSNIIIYKTSPDWDGYEAADLESVREDLDLFSDIFTKDSLTTYMTSGELCVVVAGTEEDENELRVAVIDRETATAGISAVNFGDASVLQEFLDIAISNRKQYMKGSKELQPINQRIFIMSSPESKVSAAKQARSRTRITGLLGDVLLAKLSFISGQELESKELD
jgi:hypothetical protein